MNENRIRFRHIINYILPALFTIALYVVLLLVFILPRFESQLYEKKRELVRELTKQALSITSELKNEADSGIINIEEAKKIAIQAISMMQYGEDKKGYFWITDLEPVMIFHPYRKELVGKNLDNFIDPGGKKIFHEFVALAKSDGFFRPSLFNTYPFG